MENDAAKLVAGELLGFNSRNIIVNGKAYVLTPPTIHKLCGAVYFLSDIGDYETLRDMLLKLGEMESLCKALSYMIQDNEELSEELSQGTLEEVVDALTEAFDLISIENFSKLSVLVRSAKVLTAKQR
jgi:hypothetical protein